MNNLISRQVAIRRLKKKLDKDAKGDIASFYNKIIENVITTLSEIPTIDAVPVVRCKDCKYFDLDHWETINGIPLIVAHEICTFWGWGCKTEADGYCFKGERREE